MADWCPLFGALDPTWPPRARSIFEGARRLLGVKPKDTPGRFRAEDLSLVRRLFAKVPDWVARTEQIQADTEHNRRQFPQLMFWIESQAAPPRNPTEGRVASAIVAIYWARRGCLEQSASALEEAEIALAAGRAFVERKVISGASRGGRKGAPADEPPEGRTLILDTAARLLAEGKPKRGLAGRIARALDNRYSERHINRVLSAAREPQK